MTVKIQNNDFFQTLLKEFENNKIKVGILKSTNVTYNNIDLAGIGLIQEKGSIINNIPATPWLSKPMEVDLITTTFTEKDTLNQIGKNAVKVIQDNFNSLGDGSWKANAPITINGGWMKNKVNGKSFFIKGKGFDRRLYKNGTLQNSITYEVVKK